MPDYPLSNNNRVYYAIHAIALAEIGTDTQAAHTANRAFRSASGIQSLGINTTFNLEQVFQLGQLEIYENIENIPDVEISLEKVLDGHGLLQHLSTPQTSSFHLSSRYNNNRTDVRVAYYSDEFENASGTPQSELYCSGMYVSAISLNFPIDGNSTESITLVGNDKVWCTGSSLQGGNSASGWFYENQSEFSSAGTPGSQGVLRRQDVLMSGSIFPISLPGINSIAAATGSEYTGSTYFMPYTTPSGPTALYSDAAAANGGSAASGTTGTLPVHIQSISVSTDLGRTELFELGRRGPYHRFADFPTEVTCAIEIIETEIGDGIDALAESSSNVSNEPIFIMLSDGTLIDLGEKNKLASISSSGGDTGGGNRTATFNYSNFNKFTVEQPSDPAIVNYSALTYGNLA